MHNPLTSEADMFRVVVIVGIAMALVIAVGLIDRTAGAIVLLVEAGIAVGFLWQRARGAAPRTVTVAAADDDVYRLLVVANETVGGGELLEEVRGRLTGGGRVLVVTPPLAGSAAGHWSSDIDGGIRDARQRLDAAIAAMRAAGIDVEGRLGDHHDPNQAIEDALAEFAADEVVISTHPPARSRWLESGVLERARREVPLPITHVVVDLAAESDGEAAATV